MTLRSYRAIRRQSTKGKAVEALLDEARPRVFARDGWRCRARVAADCSGRAEDLHHRRLRSAGWPVEMTHADEALLAVCRACHMHLHNHPAEARRLGLIESRYG